jgi:hypothetical protein
MQFEKKDLMMLVMPFCALVASIVNITLDSHAGRSEVRVKIERKIRDIDKEILMINKKLAADDAEESKNESDS